MGRQGNKGTRRIGGALLLGLALMAALPVAAQEGAPGKASESTLGLVIAGVVLLVVVGRRLLLLSGSKGAAASSDTIGNYGLAGAAICPRCGKPFARPPLGLNLLVGKLSRCPHCGKWSVVARATPAALAEAEAREKAQAGPTDASPALSPEEKLRRAIEASKYEQ